MGTKSVRTINYTQRPWPEAPITTAQIIPPFYDVDAIILRNGGTSTVNLWQGAWTLCPGETISFNVTLDDATLNFNDVPVTFDTTNGSINKLQIITIKSSPC